MQLRGAATLISEISAVNDITDATPVDLRKVYEESNIQQVLDQLDQELIGLKPVKSRIREIAALLLVDTISRSDTYPYVDVREDDVSMGHEATVSKVSEDQLFYLRSRGLTEEEAMAMIVRGFVEPIARELPMEYALELNRLIEMQMEGTVG